MCHVLVIEDEWLIAEHVAQLVQEAGATSVDQAATEQEAIAAALACPPDIIMSDVRLAEGDGPSAVDAIVAALGAVPVIFVTGNPEACAARHAVSAVLPKPIQDTLLVAKFREMAPLDRSSLH